MKKNLIVYAVMATDSRFGSSAVELYDNISEAYKCVEDKFYNELNLRRYSEAEGLGRITAVNDKEFSIRWYSNETKNESLEKFWVKEMEVKGKFGAV